MTIYNIEFIYIINGEQSGGTVRLAIYAQNRLYQLLEL